MARMHPERRAALSSRAAQLAEEAALGEGAGLEGCDMEDDAEDDAGGGAAGSVLKAAPKAAPCGKQTTSSARSGGKRMVGPAPTACPMRARSYLARCPCAPASPAPPLLSPSSAHTVHHLPCIWPCTILPCTIWPCTIWPHELPTPTRSTTSAPALFCDTFRSSGPTPASHAHAVCSHTPLAVGRACARRVPRA